MVKNSHSNEEDTGLIPGRGTKIPYAPGQLSPHTAIKRVHAHTKTQHSQNFFLIIFFLKVEQKISNADSGPMEKNQDFRSKRIGRLKKGQRFAGKDSKFGCFGVEFPTG